MRGALGWRLWRVARGVLRAPAPRAAEVALGVITAGFVLLLSVIPAPAAAAVAVSHYDTAAYTYDAAANLSTAHAAVGVVRGSPGAVSCASPAFVVGCCTAAETATGGSGVVDDVLAETLGATQKNITSSYTLTADEALTAGQGWVGQGYAELGKPGSGVFRSADGAQQFRMDANSLMGNHAPGAPHVHLEICAPGARVPTVNNHIPFLD